MTDGVLVIGFGNALRTDDGVGRHVAERLAHDPRLTGAVVIGRHQLTPEIALDISHADIVAFVDASHGPPAGAFTIERVDPTGSSGTRWSHHVSPSSLVALARELYGQAPVVYLISVGVESVEIGDRLSPIVEAAMPRLVDAVVELVTASPGEPDIVPIQERRRA